MGERGRAIETFFAIRPSPAIALNATDKSLTNAVYVRRPNSITKSNCQRTPSDLGYGIEPFSLFAA
jgi:hypothetical protein